MPNFKTNAAMGSLYIAGFTCILAGGPTVVTNGRTYTAGTIASIDRSSLDLLQLTSAGWFKIADATGTTAQRPIDTEHGNALPSGFHYLDTTLGKVVVRVNGAWLDINTGSVA